MFGFGSASKTSLRAADLAPDGRLNPAAIEGAQPDAGAVAQALADAQEPAHKAALALVAGLRGLPKVSPFLLEMLATDGLPGRAAGWALARLGGVENEAAVLGLVEAGNVVKRDNGYWCLATLAALGRASPGLADAMAARVDKELARARTGATGLADHALRVLAVLGDPRVPELAQKIMDGDRFADRIEINRIRKRFEESGRDREATAERAGPWTKLFADALVPEATEQPAAQPESSLLSGSAAPTPKAAAKPAAGKAPPAPPRTAPPPPEPPPAPAAPAGPVDWTAFSTSPEASALPANVKPLARQLGGLLEQVAVRGVGVPLAELTGQELMALLLQVLPQALPPQHVQAALSPEALRVYEALMKYLQRTGASPNGAELVEAVKTVRRELREQVRRSGILDGPDYSDPDEPKVHA